MKEVKLLEKQLKPTRKRQGKRTNGLPDAAAESSLSSVAVESTTSGVAANVTPDHNIPTDALVPDVTIMWQMIHTGVEVLQNGNLVTHSLMRRDQNPMLMKKLALTGAVHALVCMLMMLALGGSGCSVDAQDGFMKIALTTMM